VLTVWLEYFKGCDSVGFGLMRCVVRRTASVGEYRYPVIIKLDRRKM
jgi:hypothetical protein